MNTNSTPERRGDGGIKIQCAECKNFFDKGSIVECTLPVDDSVEYLCEACLDKSDSYCHHCGIFCAGMERYTFGPYAGFCDNCADQIKDSAYEGDEEDEYIEWPDYPPIN